MLSLKIGKYSLDRKFLNRWQNEYKKCIPQQYKRD
jgi:hypothetical protein